MSSSSMISGPIKLIRCRRVAREALGSLIDQLRMAQAQILGLEKKLTAWHRANEASRRLETIPGVGVITATALVATIGDAKIISF
jgi:transposase